jgi:hypothetical protein
VSARLITVLVISVSADVPAARVTITNAEMDLSVAGLTPIAVTIALWPEMRDGVHQRF